LRVIRVTNAMLPLLRKSHAARIVNVGSEVASLHNLAEGGNPAGEFPVLLAYNSSKSALNAVTIAYAKELADAGIREDHVDSSARALDGVVEPIELR